MNQSKRYERYGNIEFVPFSALALLRILGRCFYNNTLIISQLHVYRRFALFLRRVLPRSRLLVRVGGVYYGKHFIESAAFDRLIKAEFAYLRHADMVLSTADGTCVDLYMERVGIPRARYRKWMNGFPLIENTGNHQRLNQVVCIARLSPEKAVDYVIESFAQALPRLADPHRLVIVGEGPERTRLTDYARKLGLASHVEFVGRSYDLARHLFSSKLLVSGLSNNPVMEAIATSTPVIAVELGEMKSLYGHLPNVHVIDYPPGGCGPIGAEHRDVLVRVTADTIAQVLNDYPSHNVGEHNNRQLLSWDERLRWEIDLYDGLFDGIADGPEHATGGSDTAHAVAG